MSSTPQANSAEPIVVSRYNGKFLFFFTLIALVVVLGVGTGIFYLLRSTPEKTLQAFCDASLRADTDAAFATLSVRMKGQWPFATMNAALHDPQTRAVACSAEKVVQDGSTAKAILFRKLAGLEGACNNRQEVVLVLEDGTWKIDKFPVILNCKWDI